MRFVSWDLPVKREEDSFSSSSVYISVRSEFAPYSGITPRQIFQEFILCLFKWRGHFIFISFTFPGTEDVIKMLLWTCSGIFTTIKLVHKNKTKETNNNQNKKIKAFPHQIFFHLPFDNAHSGFLFFPTAFSFITSFP